MPSGYDITYDVTLYYTGETKKENRIVQIQL